MSEHIRNNFSSIVVGVIVLFVVSVVGIFAANHFSTSAQSGGTSTTVKIYATAGDGNLTYIASSNSGCNQTKFDAARVGVSGTADYRSAKKNNWVITGCLGNNNVHIGRGFLSFDTSSIPDDATIINSKLSLYVTSKTNNKNDGNDFISVLAGQQASSTALVSGDYSKTGTVEGADRIDITNIAANTYATWTLNSTGISWISKTGPTQFSLKEGHDILGIWPGYGKFQRNSIDAVLFEQTGTTQDPYLEITYTTGTPDTTAPSVPENLSGVATSSNRIDLSWSASTDNVAVAGYKIFRGGLEIGTTINTLFSDVGLISSTTYTYTVAAYDGANNISAQSLPLNVTTLPGEESSGTFTAPLGYVGCSMTQNAISGYGRRLGTKFWPLTSQYSGGGVYEWAKNLSDTNKYWVAFQAMLTQNPTTNTVWYELCALGNEATSETYDNALLVVNEIKRRMPGVAIYVSAQPSYDPSTHECNIAGVGGQARMASLANQLITNGEVLSGPIMGPLAYPAQTSDECHANTDGQNLMGDQLIGFFGK